MKTAKLGETHQEPPPEPSSGGRAGQLHFSGISCLSPGAGLCLALQLSPWSLLADLPPDLPFILVGLQVTCGWLVPITKIVFLFGGVWWCPCQEGHCPDFHLQLLAHLSLTPPVSVFSFSPGYGLTSLCSPSTIESSLGTAWGRTWLSAEANSSVTFAQEQNAVTCFGFIWMQLSHSILEQTWRNCSTEVSTVTSFSLALVSVGSWGLI